MVLNDKKHDEPAPPQQEVKQVWKHQEPIDVFNDPLLPDDLEPRRGSEKKKKKMGGSFGDQEKMQFEDEDEEDINFEDLDENEKY